MYSLILLEKAGTICEKKVKSFDKLYGLCNYRSEEGFELLHEWTKLNHIFMLYGKKKGKQNGENKTVLPFPLNETRFYGTLCLIKKIDGIENSLTIEEWKQFTESFQKEEAKSDDKELKKEEYEEE
jgi:hypothetical protein